MKVGGPVQSKSGREIFFGRAPQFFGSKNKLVILVSAFVMVSTVWSVSCLLFFCSWCPRAQPLVKVEPACTEVSSTAIYKKMHRENMAIQSLVGITNLPNESINIRCSKRKVTVLVYLCIFCKANLYFIIN